MKIIFETSDEGVAELVRSPFFEELVLILQKETPTLRRLKEVFGAKVEKQLNHLIKKEIIQRKDRRYLLNFPIIEVNETEIASWSSKLSASLTGIKESDRGVFLESLFPKERVDMIYGIDESVPLVYYDRMSTETFAVTSLSVDEWPLTLPRYFRSLRTMQPIPVYQTTMQLLGDVSVAYYLDQIEVIVEKLLANRRRIRDSIFVQSLTMFGLANKNETLELCVPVYTRPYVVDSFPEFEQLSIMTRRIVLARVMDELDMKTISTIFIKGER